MSKCVCHIGSFWVSFILEEEDLLLIEEEEDLLLPEEEEDARCAVGGLI